MILVSILFLISCNQNDGQGKSSSVADNIRHLARPQFSKSRRQSTAQFIEPEQPPGQQPKSDYIAARQNFQTRLSRLGPSPQRYTPLRAPSGAVAMPYQSGRLKLKAIVGPVESAGPKRPAVIFLHGGFAYGDAPGDSDWEMSKPYRDAGFIVMTPVLRGENGLPGHFTLYYDELNDVIAAAEKLATLPNVDSSRIFVACHSAGATLAVLTALASKKFRAAASISGMMDQSYLRQEESPLVRFDINDDREIAMRSPIAFATSYNCPTRLYFGNLERMHRPNNERTAAIARQADLDVAAVSSSGDHFTSVPESIRKSIEFFKQQ